MGSNTGLRVITLLALCLLPVQAMADWLGDGWLYRMPLTLQAAQVEGAHSGFPVLIDTSNEQAFVRSNLATYVAQVEDQDIVFTASDGTTILDHEIEFFDGADGRLVAWVRVPAIQDTSDTELFLYYGNPATANMQNAPGVWDSNYRLVQHLSEVGGNGTPLQDSTANGNNGTVVGTGGNFPDFIATGQAGGARNIPGNQQGNGGPDQPHLEFPHSANLAPTNLLTAEVWARADSNLGDGVNAHPILFKGRKIGWGAEYLFRIAVRDSNTMTWGVTCGGTQGWFQAGTPKFGEWAHYALTFDGTTTRAFINGEQVSSSTACSGRSLNSFSGEPMRAGWTPAREFLNNDQSFYRGDVDEIRISASARTPAWLKTQFNTQSAPESYHLFAPQQEQQSPVALYQMEQAAWTGAGGEVLDSSGNNLHGTAYGAADTNNLDPAIIGNPGTCSYGNFDGASSYVAVPHNALLNGSEALTYTAWVNPRSHSAGGGSRQVMAKSVHGGGAGRAQMGLFTGNGAFNARVETVAGRINITAALPPLDTWTHVASVFDGQSLVLYYNGSEVARADFAVTLLVENTDPLMIGKRAGSAQYFWDGFIDEVHVYTSALTGAEIITVRDAVAPCITALDGLLTSYWFDQDWVGLGSAVEDMSGNGHTGNAAGVVFRGPGASGARPGSPGTCAYAEVPLGQNVTSPVDVEMNDLDSFSVAFWLRMDRDSQNNQNPSIVAGGDLNGFYAERFEVLADFAGDANNLVFMVRQGNNNNPRERVLTWSVPEVAGNSPFAGQWVHVIARHDMGTRQLSLHINGSQVASTVYGNQGPSRLIDASGPIQVGEFSTGVASAGFDFDEFRLVGRALDTSEIQTLYLEARPCGLLDHFLVEGPASASVCLPADISIQARDVGGDILTSYEGLISLGTSSGRGNWANNTGFGALNPEPHSANDGSASYQFAAGDSGVVTLRLSNASADQLIVTVTDTDGGQTGNSDPVAFLENAFVITVDDPQGSDFVAQRDHGLRVEAVSRDPVNGECGLVTDYDGAIGLKAWLDRSADDAGGQAPILAAGGSGAVLPNSQPGTDNLTASFTQGTAAMTWQTTDVGQYRFTLKDDSSGIVVDVNGDPIAIVGSSDLFTVRPDRFEVTVAGNPEAADAIGPFFVAAGTAFSTTVRALGAAGNPTLRYGQEASAQGVDLAHTLVEPVPGAAGTLAGTNPILGASFNNGEATIADTAWNEVGIIRLQAVNDSYLSVSPRVEGASANVGRFIPDHFSVASDPGTLDAYCGVSDAFAYSGQALTWSLVPQFVITAHSLGGGVTTNYTAVDFQKLAASDIVRTPPTADSTASDAVGSPYSVDSFQDPGSLMVKAPGQMQYDFAGTDRFIYPKVIESQVGPFNPDLRITLDEVTDSDGVAAQTADVPQDIVPIAAFELRYGRMTMQNVYGPENITELQVPFRIEYWDGTRFQYNPDDSCTPWTTAAITNTAAHHTLTAAAGVFNAGEGNPLSLQPNGTRGTDTLTWAMDPWLQHFWSETGILENPSATATFGVYRGNDRIIYWREVRD